MRMRRTLQSSSKIEKEKNPEDSSNTRPSSPSDQVFRTLKKRMPQVIRLAAGEGRRPSPELFRAP
jgi:hypothetical protein